MNGIDATNRNNTTHTDVGPLDATSPEADAPTTQDQQDDYDFAWNYEENYEDYLPTYDGPSREAASEVESIRPYEVESYEAEVEVPNEIADKMAEAVASGDVDIEQLTQPEGDFGTILNQKFVDQMSTEDLLGALRDPAASRDEIADQLAAQAPDVPREEIEAAADAIVEYAEAAVADRVQKSINGRIDATLRDSMAVCDQLQSNARGIAEELVKSGATRAEMTAALREMGLAGGDASGIAKDLHIIASDPDKKLEFLSRSEGETPLFEFRESWRDVEVDLGEAFGGLREELGNLRERAQNDDFKNSRILTSGLWETPRNAAIGDMKSSMSTEHAAALDRILGSAAADGKSADEKEEHMKRVVDLAVAVGTGGMGNAALAGIAVTTSANSINNANADYQAAKVADGIGFAKDGEVRSAGAKLAATVFSAALSTGSSAVSAAKTPVNPERMRLVESNMGDVTVPETGKRILEDVWDFGANQLGQSAIEALFDN